MCMFYELICGVCALFLHFLLHTDSYSELSINYSCLSSEMYHIHSTSSILLIVTYLELEFSFLGATHIKDLERSPFLSITNMHLKVN